jgi:hypothetical protein
MDKKYKQIITALDENYAKSPNIINIWQIYLQTKRKRFTETLEQCEQMLRIIDQLGDIPLETILTLCIMSETGVL